MWNILYNTKILIKIENNRMIISHFQCRTYFILTGFQVILITWKLKICNNGFFIAIHSLFRLVFSCSLLWEFINLPLSTHFTATYSVINYEEQKLNFLQNRVEHLDGNITFRCELFLGLTIFFFLRWFGQL